MYRNSLDLVFDDRVVARRTLVGYAHINHINDEKKKISKILLRARVRTSESGHESSVVFRPLLRQSSDKIDLLDFN
jgi:hypothetical protein